MRSTRQPEPDPVSAAAPAVEPGRIDGVGHVGLTTDRRDELTDFYADVVGIHLLTRNEFISIFDVGGGTHFYLLPGPPSTYEFDFFSADLARLHARLVAAGVECTEIKHDPRSGHDTFRFSDPVGVRVVVMDRHVPGRA